MSYLSSLFIVVAVLLLPFESSHSKGLEWLNRIGSSVASAARVCLNILDLKTAKEASDASIVLPAVPLFDQTRLMRRLADNWSLRQVSLQQQPGISNPKYDNLPALERIIETTQVKLKEFKAIRQAQQLEGIELSASLISQIADLEGIGRSILRKCDPLGLLDVNLTQDIFDLYSFLFSVEMNIDSTPVSFTYSNAYGPEVSIVTTGTKIISCESEINFSEDCILKYFNHIRTIIDLNGNQNYMTPLFTFAMPGIAKVNYMTGRNFGVISTSNKRQRPESGGNLI